MTPEADDEDTWHRPDGTDARLYRVLAAAGRHRLAWEWLIRIEAFQQDCQAVRIGFVDSKTVAMSWGLYRFKPFYEPYATRRKPRFLVSKVRIFRAKTGKSVRHVAMRAGEIAIVFDIDRMASSLDSRDAQIATMARVLDAECERRRKRGSITPAARSRVNDLHLDACLQLSDLLHCSCPSLEVKRTVEYLRATAEATTANGRLRDMKARIADLQQARGYLKLASRAHSAS